MGKLNAYQRAKDEAMKIPGTRAIAFIGAWVMIGCAPVGLFAEIYGLADFDDDTCVANSGIYSCCAGGMNVARGIAQ